MMGLVQSLIGFLGRLCLSVIFIIAGVRMLLDWQGSEQYFIAILCDWLGMTIGDEKWQKIIEMAIDHSFLLLSGAVFCTLGGGLLSLLGLSVRLGAFLLLIFLIPTTVLFHHFWTMQGMDRETQMTLFIKNVSIIGGLLLLLAYGRGGCKKAKGKEKKPDNP
jgi:putative oxidoreductase